jgi:hypothetical protein
LNYFFSPHTRVRGEEKEPKVEAEGDINKRTLYANNFYIIIVL